jgi:hypothetical protein
MASAEVTVADLGCGSINGRHIRLADYEHKFFPASAQSTCNNGDKWPNDMDAFEPNSPEVALCGGSENDWALLNVAAPGIMIDHCTPLTQKLNGMCTELFDYSLENVDTDGNDNNDPASQWLTAPNLWQSTIIERLEETNCAMSPEDPSVIDFMKTLGYYYAQIKRMDNAGKQRDLLAGAIENGAIMYNDKLEIFRTSVNKHQKSVLAELTKSREKRPSFTLVGKEYGGSADEWTKVDYDKSAEALLSVDQTGTARGVRGILHDVRKSVAESANALEDAAQVIKRNAIRYSKMHQIANEKERLDSFKDRVKEASYGLFRNCLVNYQLNNEIQEEP